MSIWFRSNGAKQYQFLSNFYPCQVIVGNMVARSAEHAYQALKFVDEASVAAILDCKTAYDAWLTSRLPSMAPYLVWNNGHGWDPKAAMRRVLAAKFSVEQNPDLVRLLLDTGDEELFEHNRGPWGALNGGANWLGTMLVERREELRRG